MPRERIVECPRSENFWQAGPTGPCGPCSELYLDRGLDFGAARGPARAAITSASSSSGTSCSCSSTRTRSTSWRRCRPRTSTPAWGSTAWRRSFRTRRSVFETDQFAPLIALGEELSGARYGAEFPTDRALRILADHSRAMTFLIADGVVPSNEDRGYVLRRVMRRAIQQGRTLGLRARLPHPVLRAGHRDHGLGVPRALRAARLDPQVVGLRGGGLRTHARARHSAAGGAHRARP